VETDKAGAKTASSTVNEQGIGCTSPGKVKTASSHPYNLRARVESANATKENK
jgi:hypothetical protein